MRLLPWFACLAVITVALAACDDVATPTPTASPTLSASVSASTYLLRNSSVGNYTRTTNVTVAATTLASQDPARLAQLQQQGYQSGANAKFAQPAPPTKVVTPFAEVSTSAYIFADTNGATAFFTGESSRINQTPDGGTVSAIAAPPRTNVDDLVALQEVNPGAAPGATENRGYIGLARRGRVVIELFCRINVNATTVSDFLPLLADQETQLATLP